DAQGAFEASAAFRTATVDDTVQRCARCKRLGLARRNALAGAGTHGVPSIFGICRVRRRSAPAHCSASAPSFIYWERWGVHCGLCHGLGEATMKRLIAFSVFLPFCLAVGLGQQQGTESAAKLGRTEAMIAMRDGVKLNTAIYAPKEAKEPLPILLLRTPY